MAKFLTVDGIINHSGFGWFSLKLAIILSMFIFLSLGQLTSPAILSPYLKLNWQMSSLDTSVVSSCILFGCAVGTILFGWMGDRHGRKAALYMSLMMMIYFNFLCFFPPNPLWYGLSRVFTGMGVGGSIVNSVAYTSELFPAKYRGKLLAVSFFSSTLGIMYVDLMGYFLLNSHGWKMLLLSMLIPELLLLLTVKWFPESVRYLQSSGKPDSHQQVKCILQRLSTGNGKSFPKGLLVSPKRVDVVNKKNFWLPFHKEYVQITVSMIVMFTVFNASYFSTVFLSVYTVQNKESCLINVNLKSSDAAATVVSSNRLTNADLMLNFLLATSELAGNLLFFFIVDIIGRKWSMCFSYAYMAATYILQNICLPRWLNVLTVLSARAISAGSAIAMFTFMSESFPTTVRATGIGMCSTLGYWTLIFIPILFQDLIYVSFTAVTVTFIGLNILSFLICMTLKDTTGKQLDEE